MIGFSRALFILSVFWASACTGRGDRHPVVPVDGGIESPGDAGGGMPDAAAPDATPAEDASAMVEPCDPTAPFGRPVPYEPFAGIEVSEPWVSGDGRTLLVTHSTEDFRLELWMAARSSLAEPFPPPAPISLGAWSGSPSQSSLSGDGSALYFMEGAEIRRALATGSARAFSEPAIVDAAFPADTDYPEYPREAGGVLYYTLRELNGRRSLYAHHLATGRTDAIWYDAGDIFTFAISSNGLFLYVTFDVGHLETYRLHRATTSGPFEGPERIDAFLLGDPELSGFMPTGVTDDDCEVFGSAYDLSGVDRIYRATRGGG